jgi:hypothetical protein
MFMTLGVILPVLDDLEEDENEPDDAEKIAADELRTVLVDAITRYLQLKRAWAAANRRYSYLVPKKKKRRGCIAGKRTPRHLESRYATTSE